jgi:hypothetical protein
MSIRVLTALAADRIKLPHEEQKQKKSNSESSWKYYLLNSSGDSPVGLVLIGCGGKKSRKFGAGSSWNPVGVGPLLKLELKNGSAV